MVNNNSAALQTVEEILPGHTIVIKEPWVRLLDDLSIEFYEKEIIITIPIEGDTSEGSGK